LNGARVPDVSPGADPLGRARLRVLLVSVALAALGYLAFSLWGGWRDVVAALLRAGAAGLAALLGLSLLNYLLRFCRWQIYLRRLGSRIGWRHSMAIYLAGFALTTTPGKAGEAVRGVFLKRLGTPHVASLAAFVSERFSDLVAITAIAALGMADHPAMRPLMGLALAACLAILLLLGAGDALAALQQRTGGSTSRAGRALHHALTLARAARECHRMRVLVPATALSLLAWACEAWAFHLLLGWLGMPGPWQFSFFVYAIGMLAGALSFLPGGLGGTEAVMVGLLWWAGHPQPDAIAATLLIRVCTLWFAVALGVAALPVVTRLTRRRERAAQVADGIATRGSA
jgi:uncharacterized protein (TIRG00374 family)